MKAHPKRTNYARLRMSDKEFFMLLYCCKETGKSKTQVIVDGITMLYNRLRDERSGKQWES